MKWGLGKRVVVAPGRCCLAGQAAAFERHFPRDKKTPIRAVASLRLQAAREVERLCVAACNLSTACIRHITIVVLLLLLLPLQDAHRCGQEVGVLVRPTVYSSHFRWAPGAGRAGLATTHGY